MALACDYRICSERDAKLGLPEVTAGIPYPAGPLELVQAELDPALRRRLALFGASLTPPAALEAGVVDELAPDAELAGRAVEATLRLAHLPAYAAVKNQLRSVTLDRMRAHSEANDPLVALLMAQRR